MIRTIYHGASQIVRTPRFGGAKAYNDYGLGFYCTEDAGLAREWSVSRGSNGFINKYTIECAGLRIVNLVSPEYCLLHWVTVLLQNRDFGFTSRQLYYAGEYLKSYYSVDYQNCDCMIGYRADNSNFSFAMDFLSGSISYRQLCRAVAGSSDGHAGNASSSPGLQFVLKSNRAFDRITYSGYENTLGSEWYPAGVRRDAALRSRFDRICGETEESAADDIYILDIFNEEIKPYDRRLRV